jgi:hypothetical protein
MPAIEKGMGRGLLDVVEGYALLCMLVSGGQFPKIERSGPQRMVGLQEENGVL